MRIAGGTLAGGVAGRGYIRNLAAEAVGSAVRVTWLHEGIAAGWQGVFAVVIDGEIEGILPAGSSEYTTGELTAGNHRVDVVPFPAEVGAYPEFQGDAYGRRTFLTWPASTSEDCREYRVFSNGGSGSIDYSEPHATVTDVDVEDMRAALPTSGSGTGMLTIFGRWLGDATNNTFNVQVKNDGTFRHDLGGSYGDWTVFAKGQQYGLGFGVYVFFESDAADYSAGGDTWTFRVGPARRYLSEELAEGTWIWNVRAVDGVGNESSSLTGISVLISHRPEPVGNLSISWDGTEISLSWSALSGVLGYRIYSNYSLNHEELKDAIIEDAAWEDVTSGTSHSFTPSEDGAWRFYVRAYDSNGVESDDITLVSVDTTEIASSLALNEPEQVTVTPIAEGKFLVSWNYPVSGGADATSFRVYTDTSNVTPKFSTVAGNLSRVATPGRAFESYSFETGIYISSVYFTVRSRDASGNESGNEDLVIGVPDSTAPTFSGAVNGVAS